MATPGTASPRLSSTPNSTRMAGGFLLGMAAGLVLGLAISLGIAFYLNRTPIPFMTAKPTKAERKAARKLVSSHSFTVTSALSAAG